MTIQVSALTAASSVSASDEVLLQQGGVLKRAALSLNWVFGGTLTVSGGAGATSIQMPATGRFSIDGGGNSYLHEVAADVLAFVGGATERWRTTAGGYFKASNSGTYHSATGTYHEWYSDTDAASSVGVIKNAAATATNQHGLQIILTGDPNDATRWFAQGVGGTNERWTLRANGGLANYQANDVNLSDERVKHMLLRTPTDFRPFVKRLAGLYRPFRYIDGQDELDGLTAQDVEAIAPELVGMFAEDKKGIYTHRLQERINSVVPQILLTQDDHESRLAALEARRP